MKRLGVFLLPPRWGAIHPRVTPSIKFTGTHLYTWVERGIVRVKCLAQEHNTMSPARVRTRPFDPELSALTMRPPRLPHISAWSITKFSDQTNENVRQAVRWTNLEGLALNWFEGNHYVIFWLFVEIVVTCTRIKIRSSRINYTERLHVAS